MARDAFLTLAGRGSTLGRCSGVCVRGRAACSVSRRNSTYYLPWLTRPGLDCVVLLNNIESRFTSGRDGPRSRRDAHPVRLPKGAWPASSARRWPTAPTRARCVWRPTGGRLRLRDRRRAPDQVRPLRRARRRPRRTPRRTAGRSSSSSYPPWTRALLARGRRAAGAARAHGAGVRARSVRLPRRGQPLAPAGPEPLERRQSRAVVAERDGARVGDPAGPHPAEGARPRRRRRRWRRPPGRSPSISCGSPATRGSTSTWSAPAPAISRARCRSCMSSDLAALMSATFHEAGHAHLVELVHQKDRAARRQLASVRLFALRRRTAARGSIRRSIPRQEILDVAALLDEPARRHGRLLVVFDARYDPRIFPYRPHHYGYLHRQDSAGAAALLRGQRHAGRRARPHRRRRAQQLRDLSLPRPPDEPDTTRWPSATSHASPPPTPRW